LIDALLALGHDTDADALLKRNEEDDSAHWAWSAALLAFRRTGSSAPANKALARAVEANRDESRAWKTFDWDALDRLHAKGLISNPAGRAKSVVFTEAGLAAARRSHRLLFAKTRPKSR
jgi:hypothetical protein